WAAAGARRALREGRRAAGGDRGLPLRPCFAGGVIVHNLLFIGSPGTGKTMLARRLPTVLPPLTPAESLSTTRIYSALGRLRPDEPLLAARPPLTEGQGEQVCREAARAVAESAAMLRVPVPRTEEKALRGMA